MSLVTERHLVCDFIVSPECPESFGIDDRFIWNNLKHLRNGAKDNGWRVVKGKDICPACFEFAKNEVRSAIY